MGRHAVVPGNASGYHPPCAAWRRETHAMVMSRLSERGPGVRGLRWRLDVGELTKSDWAGVGHPAKLLATVNTTVDVGGDRAVHPIMNLSHVRTFVAIR